MKNTFRTGWIYILSHELYSNHVKIGFTERSVEERIIELESGTGVPRGLFIEYAILTSEPRKLEARIHSELSDYRIWSDKEFFKIQTHIAVRITKNLAQENNHKIYEETKTPSSEEEVEKERINNFIRRQNIIDMKIFFSKNTSKSPYNMKYFEEVGNFDISTKLKSIITKNNIFYVGDLIQKTESELLKIPLLGRDCLNQIKKELDEMELHLGMDVEDWPS